MGWTAPKTWTVGSPGTSADLNTYVRDNTTFLAGTAGASVVPNESTSSITYGDLTTVGPVVTIPTGTRALVIVSCQGYISQAGQNQFMSFAVSGASTVAANDNWAACIDSTTNESKSFGYTLSGLTPGTNTFTAKYRSSAGTATATFLRRALSVIPLP